MKPILIARCGAGREQAILSSKRGKLVCEKGELFDTTPAKMVPVLNRQLSLRDAEQNFRFKAMGCRWRWENAVNG